MIEPAEVRRAREALRDLAAQIEAGEVTATAAQRHALVGAGIALDWLAEGAGAAEEVTPEAAGAEPEGSPST